MIPFHTLSQRHLVYAYFVVWLFQFGYSLGWSCNGARAGDEACATP